MPFDCIQPPQYLLILSILLIYGLGETKIPKQIAADTGIHPNHISKVLKELKDIGVAECNQMAFRYGF